MAWFAILISEFGSSTSNCPIKNDDITVVKSENIILSTGMYKSDSANTVISENKYANDILSPDFVDIVIAKASSPPAAPPSLTTSPHPNPIQIPPTILANNGISYILGNTGPIILKNFANTANDIVATKAFFTKSNPIIENPRT